ncbi:hypothetical protein KPL78_23055 [Roseomonas sp. HJA6]|uniref:Uncharacterized protein n=1 Tax=Roseomonas alba TaxID=2846776 RepID=A0ABS7AEM5_9PROT|nr:hypothetical protein [Neoroseomonas alba]MBW6400758.1 hypothetical protein [Neoroseomonas alba]
MLALLLSPLARWAALGVVLVGLAGWGWIERAGRISADLRTAAAEAAVQGRDLAIAALERQATDAAERAARMQTVRRAVDAAPVTRACVDSPAMRAVLRGLRGDASTPGGATQPAAMPAGTDTARGAR